MDPQKKKKTGECVCVVLLFFFHVLASDWLEFRVNCSENYIPAL